MRGEALALIELRSLARGLRCLDALVKKAPVEVLEANLVEPGKHLLLFAGGVAEVDEAFREAVSVGGEDVVDRMILFDAHPALLQGLRGVEDIRTADEMDCLGVVEIDTVARALSCCDRSLKNADVTLAGLRVAGGLGGRAYYVVFGAQHDVEAALEIAEGRRELIPRPHDEMIPWLLRPAPFSVGGA
ncbi:MAG: BMC domain-containing protein [Myxococcota bacterium]